MTTLSEQIAGERRRLKSVRQLLTTAVARKSGGDPSFVPFYIALGDYIEAAMGRLHAQDVKMGDMIRRKLVTLDDKSRQALDELHERLTGNQAHLAVFSAARNALQGEGADALARFEQASAAYTAYIVASMGHHGLTTELAAKLFSEADWAWMAGITAEETALEQQLYARVHDLLPGALADLQPAAVGPA
ncbi:MAG: hypothetical protein KJ049_00515 [Gammaproteobacteria bacterium]|jgi:hypothetical protein|nr:hypothetical protein [Gammaproteobacteria bacterium]